MSKYSLSSKIILSSCMRLKPKWKQNKNPRIKAGFWVAVLVK